MQVFFCTLQGFITQFGDLFSFGWVTAIAWTIWTIFTSEEPPTRKDAERWYKRIHICIWSITSILSLLPAITGSYGPSGGLCWLESEAWRWFAFYVPLWGSIGFMLFVYARIWNEISPKNTNQQQSSDNVMKNTSNADNTTNDNNKQNTSNVTNNNTDNVTNNTDNTDVNKNESEDNINQSSSQIVGGNQESSNNNVQRQSSDNVFGSNEDNNNSSNANNNNSNENNTSNGGMIQRMKYYPFVLIACYAFATIRRLVELFSGGQAAPFWIAGIQVFTSACLGTCNALVYGLSPMIRERDKQWFQTK